MKPSDTSPGEGHESDGASYEETVRQLLRARLDRIEGRVHSAVVDADRELRSGGDIDEALVDLENELCHLRWEVDNLLEQMPEGDE